MGYSEQMVNVIHCQWEHSHGKWSTNRDNMREHIHDGQLGWVQFIAPRVISIAPPGMTPSQLGETPEHHWLLFQNAPKDLDLFCYANTF